MYTLILIVYLGGTTIASPVVYFVESESACQRALPVAADVAKKVKGYVSHIALCAKMDVPNA